MSFFTLLLLGVGRLTGEKHNELICYDREGLGKCTSDPGKHCISSTVCASVWWKETVL